MTKDQFIALGLTEEQATKAAEASQEELKGFIPKSRFDEVNEANKQLKATAKEHETQLETLKKSAGDNETLKAQIATLQADNTAKEQKYQADLKDMTLNNAIKLAIASKVHDEDLAAGLFDKSKLILSDDGKVTGLDEQIKTLGETKKFLFKEDTTQPKPGFKLGGGGNGNGGGATIDTQLASIFGNNTNNN
ncbi:phage scaffolding protein [Candidatus Clostridium stratigraminis]|uniref:Phage scaffolding protein n=1 Tax=Candidatus Clostridium stratigraminis TaxID=3381661 RepID=A0ABW8T0T1_9CLOT